MSNKLRNPFKIRASEKIDSEASFLRLFSPIVLESLIEKFNKGTLWNNVIFIHSTPGAGKSSLIRIFEPSILKLLLNSRSSSEYRELLNILKKIEVISDEIELLAVSLQCTRNYEILEELNLNPAQKSRLFFSLLNSRIIIATLRSACAINNIRFPEDVEKLDFEYNNSHLFFKTLSTPCNGKQLYDWASKIERDIYRAIDSFLPLEDSEIEGHDELFSLLTLTPDNLLYNGKKICNKFLFILDDAHKLSITQRSKLKKYLVESRGNFNIWISERIEALEAIENLGTNIERDYEEINLESFWRDNQSKFEKILKNISDRRAGISTEDVSSFQNYLSENLNESSKKESLENYIKKNLSTLKEISSYTNKFDDWIDSVEKNNDLTEYQKALSISELLILINRRIGKEQLSLDFPLSVEELEQKKAYDINAAAKLFLSKNAEIPYYFGFNSLAKSTSSNIEQFLAFSSGLFEEMISKKISGNELLLSDIEQENIMREIAEQKWNEIKKIVPFPEQVIKFLTNLGEFCVGETYKPNAPYSPGVTGFAIKPSKQLNLLSNSNKWTEDITYENLINVISTCIAFNLLEKHQTLQGKKGQLWNVYYLNRWICIHLRLPISYGGWRHKTPDELSKWAK